MIKANKNKWDQWQKNIKNAINYFCFFPYAILSLECFRTFLTATSTSRTVLLKLVWQTSRKGKVFTFTNSYTSLSSVSRSLTLFLSVSLNLFLCLSLAVLLSLYTINSLQIVVVNGELDCACELKREVNDELDCDCECDEGKLKRVVNGELDCDCELKCEVIDDC